MTRFAQALPLLAALLLLAGATRLSATTRATDYPGSVSILLGLGQVREDLDLDRSQNRRLDKLRKELKAKSKTLLRNGGGESEDGLSADQKLFALIDRNNLLALAVLSDPQRERFHEIQNRILGYTMLVSPRLQQEIGLSARQVARIENIRVRGLEVVAQANRSVDEGIISHKQRLAILRNYRSSQARDMGNVLTPKQREAFITLCGGPLAES